MMTPGYPTAFREIGFWASEHQIPLDEARRRFAQYGILRAISTSRRLHEVLAFKGGNALDFIWHPNRSTIDLDFTADPRIKPENRPETWIGLPSSSRWTLLQPRLARATVCIACAASLRATIRPSSLSKRASGLPFKTRFGCDNAWRWASRVRM